MEYKAIALDKGREKDSITTIRAYAAKTLENLVDPHYTDHSITHSVRILRLIDRILEQTNKSTLLTNLEKYVLHSAAFLHDIGMQEEEKVPLSKDRREQHENLSVSRIKKDFKTIGIIEDMVGITCEVIQGHRGNFSAKPEKIVRTAEQVRIDLLQSLLFLSDELDITHERVNTINKEKFHLDLDNNINFYKHYYTEAIDIDDIRNIVIVFRHPKDRKKEIQPLLEKLVISKIEKALNHVKPILSLKYKIDLYFNINKVTYEEDSSAEWMDGNIYEKIVAKTLLPQCVYSLKTVDFGKMKDCHNPDLFYNGNSRWEDIVNNLDIQRSQLPEIKKLSLKLMKFCCEKQSGSLLLISGEAGSGKTTLLMRLAYDMYYDEQYKGYNLLWYDGKEPYESKKIASFWESNLYPIIVFIDTPDIKTFVEEISQSKTEAPMLMIVTARQSEWDNAIGQEKLLVESIGCIQLQLLIDEEIRQLLSKLEKYSKLDKLYSLTPEERFKKFKEHCQRQLLVAMLEATKGKKFEDIIINEYENLKQTFTEAARAYELVALFYMYFVSTPESLLIRFLGCFDEQEFLDKVIDHTRLIIVRESYQSYANIEYYKARHSEIARVLISKLPDYDTETKKLKKVGTVINSIDTYIKSERYHIINFLDNYIKQILASSIKEKDNSISELKNMLYKVQRKIDNIIERIYEEKHIPELMLFSRIFYNLKMFPQNINVLKKITEIQPINIKANYRLATLLARTTMEPEENVALYYQYSYLAGNRDIKFLLDYVTYCAKHVLYNHLDPCVEGINDFITYSREEHILKEKLRALLEGYKRNRDTKKLTEEFSLLTDNLEITKKLKAKDEIDYIDLYESSDPKLALQQCETYLAIMEPNEPKGVLLRAAHIASKIPSKEDIALKYYEKLFEKHVNKKNPEDFPIVYEYIRFLLKNKIQYPKAKYYRLFTIAKEMGKNEIRIYSDFAEFLISSNDHKDIKHCKTIIDEGLSVATKIDKLYIPPTKRLRELKIELENKK